MQVRAPMIMVPRNSSSGHVLMADLGTFSATNAFDTVQGVPVDNMLVGPIAMT
jgi:hypothetical protein